MRRLLDKLFENKKLAFWLPILFAAVMYLLFLLLGGAEGKGELLTLTPIATVLWLFGSFLVVFVQVKNPRCPESFLNGMELIAVVVFVGVGLVEAVTFVISGFQSFNPLVCAGTVTYSAISAAHNKRVKQDH